MSRQLVPRNARSRPAARAGDGSGFWIAAAGIAAVAVIGAVAFFQSKGTKKSGGKRGDKASKADLISANDALLRLVRNRRMALKHASNTAAALDARVFSADSPLPPGDMVAEVRGAFESLWQSAVQDIASKMGVPPEGLMLAVEEASGVEADQQRAQLVSLEPKLVWTAEEVAEVRGEARRRYLDSVKKLIEAKKKVGGDESVNEPAFVRALLQNGPKMRNDAKAAALKARGPGAAELIPCYDAHAFKVYPQSAEERLARAEELAATIREELGCGAFADALLDAARGH